MPSQPESEWNVSQPNFCGDFYFSKPLITQCAKGRKGKSFSAFGGIALHNGFCG
jgi:hypothetical protein